MVGCAPGGVVIGLGVVEGERCRRSLARFVRASWPVLVPGERFAEGRHIDVLCDALEEVARGSCRELIINIPPRCMKSLILVNFSAWLWASDPTRRFMSASYSERLSSQHNVLARRLVRSDWYQSLFGGVDIDPRQDEKLRFQLVQGGFRFATSVGGSATGEGGDYLVVDDPHKVEDVSSDANRENVADWYDLTWSTRLNDPMRSAKVVIMQRLHEADLTGHLLAKGGWEHLCLPMEFEEHHPHRSQKDWRTRDGELLWPERVPRSAVRKAHLEMGVYGASGQYQQRPTPTGGGILKSGWWRRWDRLPRDGRGVVPWTASCVSWDMTFKETRGGSWVVGQVWGAIGARYYLLGQTRARMDFVHTAKAVEAIGRDDKGFLSRCDLPVPPAQLIEEKANGHAVISQLRNTVGGLIGIVPRESKQARVHAVSPLIEAGNVFIPKSGGWVDAFVAECSMFPNGAYDDQVDAMSQALNWLRLRNVTQQRVRVA